LPDFTPKQDRRQDESHDRPLCQRAEGDRQIEIPGLERRSAEKSQNTRYALEVIEVRQPVQGISKKKKKKKKKREIFHNEFEDSFFALPF
jgi:hypothetical protein